MRQNQFTSIARFAAGMLLMVCSLESARAGTASSVSGLYYTGVNNSYGLLNGGTTDSHWSVTYAYANRITDNPTYQGAAYVVSSNYIDGGWAPNTAAAQWITAPGAQNASGTVNVGGDSLPGSGTGTGGGNNSASYVYTLAFTIASKTDPIGTAVSNQVSITLTLAADDQAKIYVNPTLLANGSVAASNTASGTLLSAWNNTSAVTLQNYGASANANFVIGTNYLVIQVDNTDSKTGTQSANLNASGLLVYQTGTAILIDGKPNPVPEVGVWLPVVGALGLFFWQRRRSTTPGSVVTMQSKGGARCP
jgi:hypothetical protein